MNDSDEDIAFKAYLAEHGYDVSQMGQHRITSISAEDNVGVLEKNASSEVESEDEKVVLA